MDPLVKDIILALLTAIGTIALFFLKERLDKKKEKIGSGFSKI